MPLDIQTGGIADKLRNALGVRGRMPLRLDETVVSVVEVAQLHKPPYRQDAHDFAFADSVSAVLAEYSFLGVNLPASSAGALVVDGIHIKAVGVAAGWALWLGPSDSYDATDTAAPAQLVRNVERYNDNTGAVGAAAPILGFAFWGTHPTLGLGVKIWTGRTVDVDIPLKWRVTLRPGWTLALWRETTNVALEASFHGTYYPDAPTK